MVSKKKYVTATTPEGSALWCKVFEPDTKFNARGVYSTKFVIPEDEAQELVALIDAAVEEAYSTGIKGLKPAVAKGIQKKTPYVEELDEETGEPTGNLVFNFKCTATYEAADGRIKTNTVQVYDAKGKQLPKDVNIRIGNGSRIRVNFAMSGFCTPGIKTASVKLMLRAIQILELTEYSGDSSSYGFDAKEGGFTYKGAPSASAGDDSDEDDLGMDDVPF